MTSIRKATPPTVLNQPNVPLFRKNDFEVLIFQKGYDIVLEHALACPCKGISGSNKTSCRNCFGSGWIFINPLETKAIITAINRQTKYQQWSPELIGTVNVTTRDEERLSMMDKITFKNRTSILSEICKFKQTTEEDFVFTSYKINKVLNVMIYASDGAALTYIPSSKYSISTANNSVLILDGVDYPSPFNGVVSVEYEYNPSYNVIDLPHDFRSAFMINSDGKNIEYNMPVQAVARRSQYVLGESTNMGGDNILNNSTI